MKQPKECNDLDIPSTEDVYECLVSVQEGREKLHKLLFQVIPVCILAAVLIGYALTH